MGDAGNASDMWYRERTYQPPEEEEEKGAWDTAMSWAKAAGKKLSETEEQIWKSINGGN